jgi:Fe2+ transport system protein FeoA
MVIAKNFTGDVSGADSVTLASAPERSSYLLDRVSGPEQRRLSEMGLVEGAQIHVVNRGRRDMLVIRVGGSRLALARGMADCVWVR